MEKLNYLHGLRGIAAFIVVIGHYLLAFYPDFIRVSFDPYQITDPLLKALIYSPLRFFWSAELSVYIFFVLSAYVLSYKFFKYKDRSIVISSAIRRYLRLTIPILFTVFISWFLMVLHLYHNKEVGEFTGSFFLMHGWEFTPNFLLMIKQGVWDVYFNFNNQTSYNIVLWTMKIELLGSFMIFFLMYFLGNWSKRYILYGVLVISLFGSNYVAFIYGLIISDFRYSKYYQKFLDGKVAALFMLFGFMFCTYNRFFTTTGVRSMMLLGSFLMVLSLDNLPRVQILLENKVFKFLGDISFSLYLIHYLVLGSLSCILFQILSTVGVSYHVNVFITFATSILAILIIARLMYLYIDNAAVRMSKRFEKIVMNGLGQIKESR